MGGTFGLHEARSVHELVLVDLPQYLMLSCEENLMLASGMEMKKLLAAVECTIHPLNV